MSVHLCDVFLLFYLFTFLPFLIFPCKSFVNYLIYRNFAPDFHKNNRKNS